MKFIDLVVLFFNLLIFGLAAAEVGRFRKIQKENALIQRQIEDLVQENTRMSDLVLDEWETKMETGKEVIRELDRRLEEAARIPPDRQVPVDRQASAERQTPAERSASVGRRAPVARRVPAERQAPVDRQDSAEWQVPVEQQVPVGRQVSVNRRVPAAQTQAVRPVQQIPAERRILAEQQIPADRQVAMDRQYSTGRQVPMNPQVSLERQVPVERQAPLDPQVPAARRAPDTVLRSIPRRRRPADRPAAGSVSREANYYEMNDYEADFYEKHSGAPLSRGTGFLTGRQNAAPTGESVLRGTGILTGRQDAAPAGESVLRGTGLLTGRQDAAPAGESVSRGTGLLTGRQNAAPAGESVLRGTGGYGRGRDNVKPFAAAPIAYLNPDGPQVWEWMNQGMSVLEISRRLNLTQGEVLLRLNLEKKRMLSNGTGS